MFSVISYVHTIFYKIYFLFNLTLFPYIKPYQIWIGVKEVLSKQHVI